jgi:hypothetical protein
MVRPHDGRTRIVSALPQKKLRALYWATLTLALPELSSNRSIQKSQPDMEKKTLPENSCK